MTTTDPQPSRSWASLLRRADGFGLLLALAANLHCGRLTILLPDGSRHLFAGDEPGPDAVLVVHRRRLVRRLLAGGDLGFAEAYMDGDCDTPNLTALIELAALNEASLMRALEGHALVRLGHRLRHMLRGNSRAGSRRNIAQHYDLGNEFYRRWLDPTMTYSSALFAAPQQPLEAAQRNKYAEILRLSEVGPRHHLLEVGCGWGGFASFAAREIGCRVTALTISREQFDFASSRIQQDGLADRVELRLQDYREVSGRFDRIASIEMFEAVGERYWPVFFRKLRDCLAPGGVAALQVITIADRCWHSYRRGADFIQRYIFPGGMLPSPTVLRRISAEAGLAWRAERFFARHYADTLAEWQRRFQAAWPEIAPLGFDRRFKRMWEYYLAYCEAGFRAGRIDLAQLALARD